MCKFIKVTDTFKNRYVKKDGVYFRSVSGETWDVNDKDFEIYDDKLITSWVN